MRNILIAAEIFPPDIGGPATYAESLAKALHERGWQVSLICYSDEKQKDNYPLHGEPVEPFPVFRILRSPKICRVFKWHYIKYFFKLFWLARKADVIYAQGPVSSGLLATKAGRWLKKKVVVKVVGDYAWEQARNANITHLGIDEFQGKVFGGRIGTQLSWVGKLQKIEKEVCHKADSIIVPSQYLKKIVMGWGVEEEKIKVIYNAVPAYRQAGRKSDFLRKSDFQNGKFLILSIGRLVPWKGFQALIEIMPELLKENPDFRLHILGSGPDEQKLLGIISKLGLENVVTIKKATSKERDEYLQKAHLFVLNSGYEGLSHTILEAMAAGVPVIASNIGGNPEVVKDGFNGILVEYNNKEQLKEAILKLSLGSPTSIYGERSRTMREKFISHSKEVLKKFEFQTMIENTVRVLFH